MVAYYLSLTHLECLLIEGVVSFDVPSGNWRYGGLVYFKPIINQKTLPQTDYIIFKIF